MSVTTQRNVGCSSAAVAARLQLPPYAAEATVDGFARGVDAYGIAPTESSHTCGLGSTDALHCTASSNRSAAARAGCPSRPERPTTTKRLGGPVSGDACVSPLNGAPHASWAGSWSSRKLSAGAGGGTAATATAGSRAHDTTNVGKGVGGSAPPGAPPGNDGDDISGGVGVVVATAVAAARRKRRRRYAIRRAGAAAATAAAVLVPIVIMGCACPPMLTCAMVPL